jgi:sulfite exporter TauE/SafE
MYSLGRLVTYLALGTVAGAVGHAVDLAGSAVGVQRVAVMLAGAVMVGWGSIALLRALGVSLPSLMTLPSLARFVGGRIKTLRGRPPVVRALAMGLLTTLLPCGWLYAFVVTAAGTASPLMGAAVMGAFWAGTLPVLLGMGVGLERLAGPLRRHVPVATAVAIVVVGLVALSGRWNLTVAQAQGGTAADVSIDPDAPKACCHDSE